MLGIVLLWIVVYLSGMLFCKIAGEKETSQLWKHLIGFFFLIFCQGIFFFLGQILGWNFRKTAWILTVVLLMVCCLSVLICKKEVIALLSKVRKFRLEKVADGRYKALLLWLFIALIFVVSSGTAVSRNDAMVETVQRTLLTDSMNQYHPFTGKPLELGMIMSKKIITLPFWYATLSLWTGFDGVTTVWVLGSLVTILLSLMAFAELGGLLFYRDFKKTWLLLLLLELLYLSGDYYVGSAGYRQLFYGYSGEVIVGVVVIPCVLSMLYRFMGPVLREDFPREREEIRLWSLVLELGLCVGTCLFMTSLAWGFFMVMIAIALFAISCVGVRMTKRKKGESKS